MEVISLQPVYPIPAASPSPRMDPAMERKAILGDHHLRNELLVFSVTCTKIYSPKSKKIDL